MLKGIGFRVISIGRAPCCYPMLIEVLCVCHGRQPSRRESSCEQNVACEAEGVCDRRRAWRQRFHLGLTTRGHFIRCEERMDYRGSKVSLRCFQASREIRSMEKRSDVRTYHPEPCMRPISFSLGVSMECLAGSRTKSLWTCIASSRAS